MTFDAHLPALQVIVPMLSAPLIVLLTPRGLAWAGASAAAIFAFAIAISLAIATMDGSTLTYEMGGWEAPYGIVLSVDSFAAIVLLIVTGAGAITIFFGKPSVDVQIQEHRQPLFYAAWLLALAGLCGMVVTADAFNIFVFMEISSLASYILIAGGPDRRALLATFKYLIIGTVGATFYLIGVGLIYMLTGTLNMADMEARIGDVTSLSPLLAAAGFITIGLALKAAVFPLHVWLPNAYTHAPHIITAFLGACGTKVALYVLFRFNFFVFQYNLPEHPVQFAFFLMPLALLGAVIASAVAMFEGHLKRLLAFSSVAQISYILIGASLLSTEGLTASITHIFNHALAKGGLFLAIAALAIRYRDLRVDALAGAARTMPWTAAAFIVAGLSLIGIPGTAGFVSKWLLILAAMEQGQFGILLVGLIVLSSLMAVYYIWRVVETLYFGTPQATGIVAREAPPLLLIGTWIVALANLFFGLFPDIPVDLASGAAGLLLEHHR